VSPSLDISGQRSVVDTRGEADVCAAFTTEDSRPGCDGKRLNYLRVRCETMVEYASNISQGTTKSRLTQAVARDHQGKGKEKDHAKSTYT